MRFRLSIFIALVLPSISFGQFADTLEKHPPGNFDEKLFFSINHWGDDAPGLDGPMKFITNTAFVPVAAVPIGLYIAGEESGTSIAIGLAGSIVLGELLLKNTIRRVRPYHVIEGTRLITEGASGFSFPSGHSSSSIGLATGLSLYYPKWYVIVPSFLYATAVMLSRPYLGAHYPTDLLAGALLGSATQIITKIIIDNMNKESPVLWNPFSNQQEPQIKLGYSFPLR